MPFADLNVLWPRVLPVNASAPTKKGKQAAGTPAVDSGTAKQGLAALSVSAQSELRSCVDMLAHLGYSTLAFNLLLPINAYQPHMLRLLNPCAKYQAPFPDMDARKANAKAGTLLQLSRLTIALDESCISGKGNGAAFTTSNAQNLASYDIVSVLPLDNAAFVHSCLSLAPASPTSIDIITLDLASSPKLPFQLKRKTILNALQHGVCFEICYGVTMRSSQAGQPSDVPKDARRNVMAAAKELIRITKGQGIILSSEVRRCMELRSPNDLLNLASLLGMNETQAKESISDRCQAAIRRGYSNRSAYRGVIDMPVVVTHTTGSAKRAAENDEGEQQPTKKQRTDDTLTSN